MESDRNLDAEEARQNIDLDKLIEEQRKEKRKALQEKLQNKLKIIRDRRVSGVSSEPFPDSAFERLKSNNMWEEILSYLTETTDVTSAYFACRTFAEILEERRMVMTLQKVLNVFRTQVDEAYNIEGGHIGVIEYACYQNWNTICLNARSVCKAWKETVDVHYVTSRDDWFATLATERRYGCTLKAYLFAFKVEDEESVEKATSLINQGFTIPPIRDKSVLVGDRSAEGYYAKLMEYLKTHGNSVRFLHFHKDIPGINQPPAVRERLGDMLKYMTNLKELYLTLHDHVGNELQPPEVGGAIQDIHEVLNEDPLPLLKSVLHFSCLYGDMDQFLVAQILQKCINLKSLNLFLSGRLEGVITEALEGLTLERFIGRATIFTTCRVNWPLNYLEIVEWSGINASVFFPAINRFRDTLEHLHIWETVEMDVNTGNVGLEVLHLKSLLIQVIRRGTLGFDDLLPLKSLEKIIVRQVEHEDEDALVKVKGHFESGVMHKSNIWQCFPNLMWLRLGYRETSFRRPSSP